MNKFSFLNAAHTSYFETLYQEYLKNPDALEPSWKAFFQGFDFGAESVLEEGCADMVSMARPFLADENFVKKAEEGRADEINTCIGCNQG